MNESTSVLNNQLIKTVEGRQFVTFTIDDEEFGLEILKVQEIIGFVEPAHVPNSPDFIRGVINLRGIIIPIIDLRKKFHMPDKDYNKFTVIVVLEVASKTIGIIVDAVSDVLSLSDDDIQPPPDFSKFKSEFLKGMGKAGDKLVILLDIDKILNYDEFKQVAKLDNN